MLYALAVRASSVSFRPRHRCRLLFVRAHLGRRSALTARRSALDLRHTLDVIRDFEVLPVAKLTRSHSHRSDSQNIEVESQLEVP